MKHVDIIQAILCKCEMATPNSKAGRLAKEIMAIIQISTEPARRPPVNEFDPVTQVGFQNLHRIRPLVIFDLECSSKEVSEARIIEFAAVKIHPDGTKEEYQTLINPGFKITAEISELTGITNEDLAAAQPFSYFGPGIFGWIDGCDVAGYNIRNYDGPVLYEELNAIGIKWKIGQEQILDVMEIFHKMEPRSLAGATRFYTGMDHDDAHRAMPDVKATFEVLSAQLERYPGLPGTIEGLIQETKRDRRIDMAGYFILSEDGTPCFGFGKHKDKPVFSQRGYMRWMLGESFPSNTKEVCDYLLSP